MPKAKKNRTYRTRLTTRKLRMCLWQQIAMSTTGIIEMVAVHSIAFSCFEKVSGILEKALNAAVNRRSVTSLVGDVAKVIREMLVADLIGKFICLKFDGVSRNNRKILGINAQYIKNGQVVIRTLSMEDMTEKQTAENLKNRVEDVLAKHHIDTLNLYACTTDRAKHMLKSTNELRHYQEQALILNSNSSEIKKVFFENSATEDDSFLVRSEMDKSDTPETEIASDDKLVDDMLEELSGIEFNGDEV